jgi:hypothetical protein
VATSNTELHNVALEVRARVTERPAEPGTIVAYAFSQGGALLDMRALDQEDNARLSIAIGKEGQLVRVMIGPALDKASVSAGELLRRGASDKHVPVRPAMQRIPPVPFEVTPDIRRIWLGDCAWSTARG